MNRKTVLIGLDGCDFRILDPLVREGSLPTFRELMGSGCRATLLSTLPCNTLPSWNSIFTGVNPGKHGITDFVIREGGKISLANSGYRMVDPIWSILSDRAVPQIIVNEPVTYPPLTIDGVMVCGLAVPPGQKYCFPEEVQREIEGACEDYLPDLPSGFDATIAGDRAVGKEMIHHFAKNTFDATDYLMRKYDWQLLATIFTSTDRFQHFYLDDEQGIRDHYILIDGLIKKILERAPDANVLLLSDHGFGPIRKCFYVNTWFKSKGLLKADGGGLHSILSRAGVSYPSLVRGLSKVGLYGLARRLAPRSLKKAVPELPHEQKLDPRTSRMFMPSLNSGVFVGGGLSDATVSGVKQELASLAFEGQQVVEKVVPREEVVWGPFSHRSGDFHIVPVYGYEVSHRIMQSCFESPNLSGDIRTGTHRREGIFIAHGPDFAQGTSLGSSLNTWDVAPTLLHLMGLSVPDYMDGRVVHEAFRPGSVPQSSEVRIAPSSRRERIRKHLRVSQFRKH